MVAETAERQGAHMIEIQRRRLMMAIIDALAEDGLERVSVGVVCKRAHVSRRTFYEQFDGIEGCLLAAFEQALDMLLHKVEPVYVRAGRWRERVRSALTVLLECFDEEPALAWLCLVETLKAGPVVGERRRDAIEALTAAIGEGRLEARGDMASLPLTAESTVGGALSVVAARLTEGDPRPLVELVDPLMSMIVHPYLGDAAAHRELERRPPLAGVASVKALKAREPVGDPFEDLEIRITFRTAMVLATVSAQPGASNRMLGQAAGVGDQGQMSKLLRRLERSGLIENHGAGHQRGEPNAWKLTARGGALHAALDAQHGAAV